MKEEKKYLPDDAEEYPDDESMANEDMEIVWEAHNPEMDDLDNREGHEVLPEETTYTMIE